MERYSATVVRERFVYDRKGDCFVVEHRGGVWYASQCTGASFLGSRLIHKVFDAPTYEAVVAMAQSNGV